MAEEIKLPVVGADSCPHCGSKERVLEKMIRKLKDEGKLPEQSFPKGAVLQITLFDPARMPLLATKVMVPIAFVFWDICLECKTIYSTGVELLEQPAQMKMAPQTPGFDPIGGKSKPS